MRASDVMVRDVITVGPQTSVEAAVRLLAEYDVSTLPVLGEDGGLVGIISEAELIHRAEIGTEKPIRLPRISLNRTARKVGEIMTTDVVSVSEDTSLAEIAALFECKRIKRVPVVKDGQLVGIVSRSNLIQALASRFSAGEQLPETDRRVRLELLALSRAAKRAQWTAIRAARGRAR